LPQGLISAWATVLFFFFLLLLLWGSASQSRTIRRQGAAMQHRPGEAQQKRGFGWMLIVANWSLASYTFVYLCLPFDKSSGGSSKTDQALVPVLGMPSVYGAKLHLRTHYAAVSPTLISCSHFSGLLVLVKRPIIMPHGLWDAQFGTNRGWDNSRLSCAPGLGQ
jgi:hypothetical protein